MKSIVGLLAVLGIGVFVMSMLLSSEAVRDQGRPLAIAWGRAMNETVELQLGVPPLVLAADPPIVDEKRKETMDEWITGHFQLRDEGGAPVPLRKMGTSAMFVGEKAGGAPEFILCADLKKGARYSFDFVPIVREGNTYRHTFTVPQESQKVTRELFEPVAKK